MTETPTPSQVIDYLESDELEAHVIAKRVAQCWPVIKAALIAAQAVQQERERAVMGKEAACFDANLESQMKSFDEAIKLLQEREPARRAAPDADTIGDDPTVDKALDLAIDLQRSVERIGWGGSWPLLHPAHAAARSQAAEQMREACAAKAEQCLNYELADFIRALPLPGEKP